MGTQQEKEERGFWGETSETAGPGVSLTVIEKDGRREGSEYRGEARWKG